MYQVKTHYVFGKRNKAGQYLAGHYEYRDMFTKPQVQKVKKFIQSLEKKQFTPANVEKEKFDTGRYFLFDCYGNLLYLGTSGTSFEKGIGIKKELRKFYQADNTGSRAGLTKREFEYTQKYSPKPYELEESTHPSADPEIRKRICTYAVQYVEFTGRTYDDEDTKNPAFFIPCGLHNDLPRKESCNADMRELIINTPHKVLKAFTTSLPTIFNNKKAIAKLPIIQCKQFDYPKSGITSCRAVKFVKPIK